MPRKIKKYRKYVNINRVVLPKVVWIGIGFFVLFLTSTVFIAVQTAATGAKIAKIESEEQVLIRESNETSSVLIEKSSLVLIAQKADEMGFIKPQNIIYTQNKDITAKLP